MTPHLNMRTPWKSIDDIKADYILDVKEKGHIFHRGAYDNAAAALLAVHGLNWNERRAMILGWMHELQERPHAAE